MFDIGKGRDSAGKLLSGFVLAWLLVSSVSAETITRTGRFLAKQQWVQAENSARAVLEKSPHDPDAHAMLGIALYHQGRFKESTSALQFAARGKSAYEARVLYYLGLAHSKLEQPEKAENVFLRLMMRHPDSPEARKLQGVSADITVSAEKRTGMDISGTVFSLDAGYDTNPDLINGGDGDLQTSFYLYSDLGFESMPCLIGVSVFFEKYLDLTENDFVEIAVDLNDQFNVGKHDLVESSVEISQSLLDFEAFERNMSASVEYTHPWSRVWTSELRALGALTDADDEGYDAIRARLRFRHYRYLLDARRLKRVRLTVKTYMNNRDTDSIAYTSVSGGIDCRLDLPFNTMLDLGLLLESREYAGADSDTLITREDSIMELSAYALKPVQKNQYLTGQAILRTRDSNDGFYSADELQLLVGFLWVK